MVDVTGGFASLNAPATGYDAFGIEETASTTRALNTLRRSIRPFPSSIFHFPLPRAPGSEWFDNAHHPEPVEGLVETAFSIRRQPYGCFAESGAGAALAGAAGDSDSPDFRNWASEFAAAPPFAGAGVSLAGVGGADGADSAAAGFFAGDDAAGLNCIGSFRGAGVAAAPAGFSAPSIIISAIRSLSLAMGSICDEKL